MNARQFGLKLIANVTYGYTSASFSGRMPMAELADSIVQARTRVCGSVCVLGGCVVNTALPAATARRVATWLRAPQTRTCPAKWPSLGGAPPPTPTPPAVWAPDAGERDPAGGGPPRLAGARRVRRHRWGRGAAKGLGGNRNTCVDTHTHTHTHKPPNHAHHRQSLCPAARPLPRGGVPHRVRRAHAPHTHKHTHAHAHTQTHAHTPSTLCFLPACHTLCTTPAPAAVNFPHTPSAL